MSFFFWRKKKPKQGSRLQTKSPQVKKERTASVFGSLFRRNNKRYNSRQAIGEFTEYAAVDESKKLFTLAPDANFLSIGDNVYGTPHNVKKIPRVRGVGVFASIRRSFRPSSRRGRKNSVKKKVQKKESGYRSNSWSDDGIPSNARPAESFAAKNKFPGTSEIQKKAHRLDEASIPVPVQPKKNLQKKKSGPVNEVRTTLQESLVQVKKSFEITKVENSFEAINSKNLSDSLETRKSEQWKQSEFSNEKQKSWAQKTSGKKSGNSISLNAQTHLVSSKDIQLEQNAVLPGTSRKQKTDQVATHLDSEMAFLPRSKNTQVDIPDGRKPEIDLANPPPVKPRLQRKSRRMQKSHLEVPDASVVPL